MIDLECASLPEIIVTTAGEEVRVKTDFRLWIRFSRLLSEQHICDPHVLADHPSLPEGDWRPGAVEFCSSPCPTPRATGQGERVMDILLDGDYLVAAFQQSYAIDLTDPGLQMHWHRFLALMRGLPQGTKLADIVGYRSWDPSLSRRRQEDGYAEAKRVWALPEKEDKDLVAIQMAAFGNIEPPIGGE